MIDALIIYDEKISSKNQCEALLSELRRNKKINCEYLIIKKNFFHFFPNSLIFFFLNFFYFPNKIKKKNYKFILSCGRTSAPYNLFFSKRKYTQSYHILDPYFRRNFFKNIIVPHHDKKKFQNYKNIFFTTGSLTKQIKSQQKNHKNKKEIISILIGGSGKSSKFKIQDIDSCVKIINNFKSKYYVNYCFSRRTPKEIKKYIISNKYKLHNHYPRRNLNPYEDLLETSDYFVITEDSVGMISDALSTGKSVYVIKIKSLKRKLKSFSEFLINKKYVRVFDGKLEKFSYKPLNETKRVANLILQNITNDYEPKSTDLDTF